VRYSTDSLWPDNVLGLTVVDWLSRLADQA
jgi:hypothetical protein